MKLPVGKRPALVGFMVEVAQLLLMSCDAASPDYFNEQLRDMLAVRLCVRVCVCWVGGNCSGVPLCLGSA